MILHASKGTDIKGELVKAGFPFLCGGTGSCGKCRVRVLSGEAAVSEADRIIFSEEEISAGMRLACMMGEACGDLEIEYELPDEEMYIPVDTAEGPGEAPVRDFSLAIDIGTTTIAVAAVGRNGEIIGVRTGVNHQRSFGADVVSRIVASNNGHGPEMRDIVISDINELVDALMSENGLRAEGLSAIVIAGNTTMQHIFAGYSCEGLGMAPFTPVSVELTRTDSGLLLPGISAYVGSDIVAGIYECGFDDELTLLVDLGTNGEMALGTSERIFVTSTAAGPAFEGGNISCGCAGIPGAVYDVDLSDRDGDEPIVLKLIGEAGSTDKSLKQEECLKREPVGICGTGVVALVAELYRNGLLDSTGLLDERLRGRIRLTQDGKVRFTQKDIRELQLAKAAIRAGIDILLEAYGAEAGDIRKVYISGGFGSEINASKAALTGLIPNVLVQKCIPAGNTALKGAIRFLGDPDGTAELNRIVSVSKEVVLADQPDFTESFMNHMELGLN